ncbi:MAG TPA: cytochrome D1 domain-containing protein [Gemmatimonadales bacterium]|nr:cytochrome D1 domain-containing protein [Gemmatimonadales bacterium]
MGNRRGIVCGVAAFAILLSSSAAQRRTYFVYVASEAADRISLIRFGPEGARVEREIPTGVMPTDIDGPHGLAVSPDHAYYYVSIAHGQPNGSLWKYSTRDDKPIGRVNLGMFPATLDVSPDGDFLYVVNFNLHGDMVPSTVSVVTPDMTEIARIQTCAMPHGSRLSADGARHYSVCMMDEQLVEIDTAALKVSRHFVLTRGREAGMIGPPMHVQHAGRAPTASGHGTEAPAAGDISCSPTWAQPSKTAASVFVACNGSSEIVEIGIPGWTLLRRIPAAAGVYNLAATRDGRIVATNRRDQSVSVFDEKSGTELARLRTRRKVVHGVVVSPDDRYAFVSVEGVAAEPGTVEVLDLASLKIVASVDVGPQAGGIDVVRVVD